MAKPTKRHTPVLIRLMSLLGETKVSEQYISKESKRDIYGHLMTDGSIVVNPVPHVVDTLLHELLHKMHPGYSEQAVRSLVGKLMKQATDADLQAIYDMYTKKTCE